MSLAILRTMTRVNIALPSAFCIPKFLFLEWQGWYDSYALLLCDYLCSALPQLTSPGSPSASLCKEAVTKLTGYLLGRLGQEPGNSEVSTAAILALAGGETLSPEKRVRHAAILRGESPAPALRRRTPRRRPRRAGAARARPTQAAPRRQAVCCW